MLFIAPIAFRLFCTAIIFWQGDHLILTLCSAHLCCSFMWAVKSCPSHTHIDSKLPWEKVHLKDICQRQKKLVLKQETQPKLSKGVFWHVLFIFHCVCLSEHECVQNPKRPLRAALGKERLCMAWYSCGDRNGSLGNVVISWLHMWCLYQGVWATVMARAHGRWSYCTVPQDGAELIGFAYTT